MKRLAGDDVRQHVILAGDAAQRRVSQQLGELVEERVADEQIIAADVRAVDLRQHSAPLFALDIESRSACQLLQHRFQHARCRLKGRALRAKASHDVR